MRSNTPARFHQALPGLTQGRRGDGRASPWPVQGWLPESPFPVTPRSSHRWHVLVPLVAAGCPGAGLKPPLFSFLGGRGEGSQRLHPPGRGKSHGGWSWEGVSLPAGGAPPSLPALGLGWGGLLRKDSHPPILIASARLGWDGEGSPRRGCPCGSGGGCLVLGDWGGGGSCFFLPQVPALPVPQFPRSAKRSCLSPVLQRQPPSYPIVFPPPKKNPHCALRSPGLLMPGHPQPYLAPGLGFPDGSSLSEITPWFRHRGGGGEAGGGVCVGVLGGGGG